MNYNKRLIICSGSVAYWRSKLVLTNTEKNGSAQASVNCSSNISLYKNVSEIYCIYVLESEKLVVYC